MKLNNILLFLLFIASTNLFGQKTLIRNVSIITMTKETVDAPQDILIDNGKIAQIGRNLQQKGAAVVDGTGKYVIPGLMDMHAHFYYEQGNNVNTCENELKLMLANGLTTVRIACGDPVYLEAKKMANSGKWAGPDLLVAGPQFVGRWPYQGKVFANICTTPEEGRAAVQKTKREGYDAVKISIEVQPEVYKAINEEAARVGLPVFGHVGAFVKLPMSLQYKQQNEHMDEFIDMLLPDPSLNEGQSVSDMNLWKAKAWETVPKLDESKIPSLVQQVRDAGIYVSPTNYFFYTFFGKTINQDFATTNPEFAYVPSALKTEAWDIRSRYINKLPPEASRERYIAIRTRLIQDLWKAGVPLMAGSDSPQWFNVTGFAIHNEIENLVVCGLTPYAALQTATINPAKYLKVDNRKGSIAVGLDADLLILSQNPLADIRNARKIDAIFKAGKHYDSKAVQKLLDDAKQLSQ